MFQFRVWRGDWKGDLGLALAHPLYILVAKAFTLLPVGGFAFRVNLFSAVCGAACLGFMIDLLFSLTRCRTSAAVGTVLLAVSHTFWTHAVMAEVYELYALGLLVELWLLERFFSRSQVRWLVLAMLVNGLNLSNHLFAVLHLPAYFGVVVWAARMRQLRIREAVLLPVVFLAGASVYLTLIGTQIAGGQPLWEALEEAVLGPPHRAERVLALTFPLGRQTIRSIEYFVMNFPTPLALAAPVGLWLGWKNARLRWVTAFGGAVFLVAFVFAFRYPVPDQYVFFFPCYVLLPVFTVLALPGWLRRSAARRVLCLVLAIVPVAVYEAAPPVLHAMNVAIDVKRRLPFRETHVYFLRPRKNGEDGAARFARAALSQAGHGGLLIADTTMMNVLVYTRDVEGIGRGVTLSLGGDVVPASPAVPLTPEAVEPFVRKGSAYLCSDAVGYAPAWLLDKYARVPVDGVDPAGVPVCYRLVIKTNE